MQSITNTRQIDRTDYAPFLWRRDRSNANMETPLPEKFRTMLSPLSAPPEKYALDASYQPSLQGFHSLNASGNRPHFPETDSVEALIALTKEMEEGDWLHFHCVAGKGRLTALFAVYDILKNPGVPLKDILYRQCMLGGNYMLFQGDGGWKDPYYLGKAEMTQKFYRYVQENHETGYRVRWTAWLAAQGCA